MSKSVLAFGLGIIVGVGGMWFFNKPKDMSTDGSMESYSMPMSNDSQPAPAPTEPAPAPAPDQIPPTGSVAEPLNLSDASNANTMQNGMDNMNNNPANTPNNTMNDMQDQANSNMDAAQDAANQNMDNTMGNMPNQGNAPAQGQGGN